MEMAWKSVESWTGEGLLQPDQEHVAEEGERRKAVRAEKEQLQRNIQTDSLKV